MCTLPLNVCVPFSLLYLQSPCTVEERPKHVQRYVLQAARVTQAQQSQELRVGTEKGLEALTKELFQASQVCQGRLLL